MDGTRIAYYFPIYNTFRRMVLWNFTMGNCNVWLFTLSKYSERGKSYPFFKTRASIGLPTVQSIQIVISQLLPILCLFTISYYLKKQVPYYAPVLAIQLPKSAKFFGIIVQIGKMQITRRHV